MSEAAALSKKEQVFKVCDELSAKGEKVTEAQVLGITGFSSTTVHRYVSDWKKSAALHLKAPQIPTAFLESFNKLFSNIRTELEAEYETKKEEWEQEIDRLSNQIEGLELRNREEHEKTLRLQKQVFDQTKTIARLEESAEELRSERSSLTENLRKRLEDIELLRSEHTAALARERQRAQDEIERLDRLYQVSEKRMVETMDKERNRIEGNLKETSAALDSCKEKYEAIRQSQKIAEIELGTKATQIQNLEDRLDEFKASVRALTDTNENLREDNGQLRLEVERLKMTDRQM